MLNINKTITVTGNSVINGTTVVYMSATLSTDGTTNNSTTKTIANKELYDANKVEVRKDIANFESEIFKIEDEISQGNLE